MVGSIQVIELIGPGLIALGVIQSRLPIEVRAIQRLAIQPENLRSEEWQALETGRTLWGQV